MTKLTAPLLLSLLLFCLSVSANGESCDKQTFTRELNSFISSNSSDVAPGYSALLARDGRILCQEAVGLASAELSVPLTPEHIFEIGSLTKQFTSVAVLLLVQDNKLRLEDDIKTFLPAINSTKGKVTLGHLLAHTSGLVDPINQPEFLATRIQESISLTELVDLFQNGNWQHLPGERVVYSNVGYSLLAHIVELVSGKSWFEFLSDRVFKPLNMRSTYQAGFALVPGKVSGYTWHQQSLRQHGLINLAWAYGAGDLLSTTLDLFAFNEALMGGKLLESELLRVLFAPIKLNSGDRLNGSFNTSLSTVAGQKAMRISGSTMGYSSHSIYLPESRYYVVVLHNSDGINGGDWIAPATVAAKLIARQLDLPIPDYQKVNISAETAHDLVGQYRLDAETVRELRFEGGRFYYSRNGGPDLEVLPMANGGFYFPDTLAYFYIQNSKSKRQSMAFYYLLSSEPEVAVKIH